MIERTTGPFHGYYIAAFACPMGDMGQQYLGQFKIFRRPACFLDDGSQHHGYCDAVSATSAAALSAAESQGMREVDRLGGAGGRVVHWRLAGCQ